MGQGKEGSTYQNTYSRPVTKKKKPGHQLGSEKVGAALKGGEPGWGRRPKDAEVRDLRGGPIRAVERNLLQIKIDELCA